MAHRRSPSGHCAGAQGRAEHAVGVSRDGQRVVTCRNNGSPTVWDETTDTLHAPTEDHLACAVAISADGAIAVSGDADGTLRAWDVMSGQSIGTVQPHHHRITAIAITANGSLAAAGDEAGRVLRWELAGDRDQRCRASRRRLGDRGDGRWRAHAERRR